MKEAPFQRIYVEISNICNLQCSFCPPVERHQQVMSLTDLQRILPQLQGLTHEICLHLMGEPLGHPHLSQVIEAVAATGLRIQLTTNGVLLSSQRQELCLHPSIRQVNISIHSFEANFGSRDVGPYLRKVFAFTRRALETRPDLYINYRLWDLHEPRSLNTTNAAIRTAIENEFMFSFADLNIDIRRQKGYPICGRLYVHFDSRFVWPSLQQEMRSQIGTCHALRSHIGIHADGTVVPCCLDKEAVINLGNCLETPLQNLLNGPRAQAMRRGFANGHLVENLCQRCNFVARFDRKAHSLTNNSRRLHIDESVNESAIAFGDHSNAPIELER
jgi:radical SAM protein with 4Fe4S-binding SPASM domain